MSCHYVCMICIDFRSFLLFSSAVGTAGLFLKPHHNTSIMEDMVTIEQSYDFSLNESLQANGALLLGLSHLHLLYPLQARFSQPHQFLLQTLLLQSELHRILQHQSVKFLPTHPVNRRLLRWILLIVVGIDDGLVLILIIDEVEVVFSIGIELYRSV